MSEVCEACAWGSHPQLVILLAMACSMFQSSQCLSVLWSCATQVLVEKFSGGEDSSKAPFDVGRVGTPGHQAAPVGRARCIWKKGLRREVALGAE